MLARIILLTASLLAAAPVFGRSPSHPAPVCGLVGTPASVVVDVYDSVTGSLLDTIANGEVIRFGSSDCFTVNLATTVATIGYPAPGSTSEKHYFMQFRDDGAITREREESIFGPVGFGRVSDECVRETAVYPTVVIPSRGIGQREISRGRPNYFQFDVACDRDFDAPDYTYYWVFSYDASGRSSVRFSDTAPPSP